MTHEVVVQGLYAVLRIHLNILTKYWVVTILCILAAESYNKSNFGIYGLILSYHYF